MLTLCVQGGIATSATSTARRNDGTQRVVVNPLEMS